MAARRRRGEEEIGMVRWVGGFAGGFGGEVMRCARLWSGAWIAWSVSVRGGLSDCGGGRSTDGVNAGRWFLFDVAMRWFDFGVV